MNPHCHKIVDRYSIVALLFQCLDELGSGSVNPHREEIISCQMVITQGAQLAYELQADIVHRHRKQSLVCHLLVAKTSHFVGEVLIWCKREMSRAVAILEPALAIQRSGVPHNLKVDR